MSRVNSGEILRELKTLNSHVEGDDKALFDFRRMIQLIISTKLGGKNWPQLATQVSSKLQPVASKLSKRGHVNSAITANPAVALECLKLANWKFDDKSGEPHPSQKDSTYLEFCDALNEKPEDLKSLMLYFTAATVKENLFHTLTASTQTHLNQDKESFKKTVDDIQSFSGAKLAENPEVFNESYATLLSSLDFDKNHIQRMARDSHLDLPCFRAPPEKVEKWAKLLTIQDHVDSMHKYNVRVNPNKISVSSKQAFDSLNEFIAKTKNSSSLPPTAEVDNALKEAARTVVSYRDAQFTEPEYVQHLIETYHNISRKLTSFPHNPALLIPIGERLLFKAPERLDSNIPIDQLEAKVEELQTRLNKALLIKDRIN